jgi:hypothetical protein
MERKLDEVKRKVIAALSLPNTIHLELKMPEQLQTVTKVMKNRIYRPSRSLVRKVVTGDEKKRVRDLIKEKKDKPQYIKLFDKISFTFFTLNLPICQYFLFNRPNYFGLWFSFIIPLLLIARYFYFHTIKMEYFLYDFCYFSNFLSLLCVFYSPPWLFRMVFIFTNGPVTLAILIWRLSLVFHDFDRVTSIYIHLLPACLFFVLRWEVLAPEAVQSLSWRDFVNACLGYLFWQIVYFLKTEVFDREKLDSNPELLTSLRWLATDKKNPTARFVLKLLRSVGLMRPDEDYVPNEFKTKFIFMSSQFCYTVLTFLPSFLVYYSYHLHLLYILLVFANSVYNGASFYIEIFSQRYQLQFAKKEDMQQVVQAAAEIAIQAAAAAVNSPSSSSDLTTPVEGASPTEIIIETFGGDARPVIAPPSPIKRMLNEVNESQQQLLLQQEHHDEDKALRRNESIRVAIEEATAAFVEEWAASASDHHSCEVSEGRLSDLDSSHHDRDGSFSEENYSEGSVNGLESEKEEESEPSSLPSDSLGGDPEPPSAPSREAPETVARPGDAVQLEKNKDV